MSEHAGLSEWRGSRARIRVVLRRTRISHTKHMPRQAEAWTQKETSARGLVASGCDKDPLVGRANVYDATTRPQLKKGAVRVLGPPPALASMAKRSIMSVCGSVRVAGSGTGCGGVDRIWMARSLVRGAVGRRALGALCGQYESA